MGVTVTPLKINGWNIIIMEVWFRSCSFLFMGDGCRFQPLIFAGCISLHLYLVEILFLGIMTGYT